MTNNNQHIPFPEEPNVQERRNYGNEVAISAILENLYEQAPPKAAPLITHASRVPSKNLTPLASAKKSNFPWLGIAALVTISAILFFTLDPLHQQAANEPSLTQQTGSSELLQRNIIQKYLGKPAILAAGQKVQIGSKETAKFSYLDGTTFTLFPGSTITIPDSSTNSVAKHIQLLKGEIHIKANEQKPSNAMRIFTEHSTTEVIGTVFRVKHSKTHTETSVSSGRVQVFTPENQPIFEIAKDQIGRIGPDISELKSNKNKTRTASIHIQSFTLINALTGKAIPGYNSLQNNCFIPIHTLPKTGVNIRINTSEEVASLVLSDSTEKNKRSEIYKPFCLVTDSLHEGGSSDSMLLKPGKRIILAKPVLKNGQSGTPRKITINFTR